MVASAGAAYIGGRLLRRYRRSVLKAYRPGRDVSVDGRRTQASSDRDLAVSAAALVLVGVSRLVGSRVLLGAGVLALFLPQRCC